MGVLTEACALNCGKHTIPLLAPPGHAWRSVVSDNGEWIAWFAGPGGEKNYIYLDGCEPMPEHNENEM